MIDDVLETPANHIFVIKEKGQDDIYVPVVKEWVTDIDTANKTVKVHLLKIAED